MKKNILITAISVILAIFLITGVLQGDDKYSGNVHEYLIEQSYELLKIDMEHEFPEMNDYLDKLKKGVQNEDKQDWVYNYNEDNPPDFNQLLLPAAFYECKIEFKVPIGTIYL
ncbi:MAG: hypothetical protein P9L89_04165 [Candidatus Celaenobacter polaris]|nr:hypothetical protein [Candidatus Celaenobacter polaris]